MSEESEHEFKPYPGHPGYPNHDNYDHLAGLPSLGGSGITVGTPYSDERVVVTSCVQDPGPFECTTYRGEPSPPLMDAIAPKLANRATEPLEPWPAQSESKPFPIWAIAILVTTIIALVLLGVVALALCLRPEGLHVF